MPWKDQSILFNFTHAKSTRVWAYSYWKGLISYPFPLISSLLLLYFFLYFYLSPSFLFLTQIRLILLTLTPPTPILPLIEFTTLGEIKFGCIIKSKYPLKLGTNRKDVSKIASNYWGVHIFAQLYTENHATIPKQIHELTVQICGNFWVTQYEPHWFSYDDVRERERKWLLISRCAHMM